MPKAKLGQHFLIDRTVRDRIVDAAQIGPKDEVLEIGPGLGILTSALLNKAAELTAIEKDEKLASDLRWGVGKDPRLKVVTADFLSLDLATLGEGPFIVVSNLPYAVASPILQRLLEWPRWTRAVLMFQKEVAERVTAATGGPDYGLLTLSALLRTEPRFLFEVPPAAFAPRPQIFSAVVLLTPRPSPLADSALQETFWRIAKPAFRQRRKMAVGLIAEALGRPKSEVARTFKSCGIPAGARAQTIPLEGFLALAHALGLGRAS